MGLALEVTGIASAGRDLRQAEAQSIRAIENWTVVIVIVLLLLLYRAPLMAVIPLATVYIAVQIALHVLALLAGTGILPLDRDSRIFITVLAYGAGVDYCVFLIARYREELDTGAEVQEALTRTIGRAGTAVSASAATVICGIGMMAFAQFGKIWVVPGPPPAHLTGTQEMDIQTFIEKVVNFAGQGIMIELEPKLTADLRSLLDDWKRVK